MNSASRLLQNAFLFFIAAGTVAIAAQTRSGLLAILFAATSLVCRSLIAALLRRPADVLGVPCWFWGMMPLPIFFFVGVHEIESRSDIRFVKPQRSSMPLPPGSIPVDQMKPGQRIDYRGFKARLSGVVHERLCTIEYEGTSKSQPWVRSYELQRTSREEYERLKQWEGVPFPDPWPVRKHQYLAPGQVFFKYYDGYPIPVVITKVLSPNQCEVQPIRFSYNHRTHTPASALALGSQPWLKVVWEELIERTDSATASDLRQGDAVVSTTERTPHLTWRVMSIDGENVRLAYWDNAAEQRDVNARLLHKLPADFTAGASRSQHADWNETQLAAIAKDASIVNRLPRLEASEPFKFPRSNITDATRLHPGQRVAVRHKSEYYQGRVIGHLKHDKVLIDFSGPSGSRNLNVEMHRHSLHTTYEEEFHRCKQLNHLLRFVPEPLPENYVLKVGDLVLCQRDDYWLPAAIVEYSPDGQFEVDWLAFDPSYNEIVPRARMTTLQLRKWEYLKRKRIQDALEENTRALKNDLVVLETPPFQTWRVTSLTRSDYTLTAVHDPEQMKTVKRVFRLGEDLSTVSLLKEQREQRLERERLAAIPGDPVDDPDQLAPGQTVGVKLKNGWWRGYFVGRYETEPLVAMEGHRSLAKVSIENLRVITQEKYDVMEDNDFPNGTSDDRGAVRKLNPAVAVGPGRLVSAKYNGGYIPVIVTAAAPDGRFEIHPIGFSTDYNRVVSIADLRILPGTMWDTVIEYLLDTAQRIAPEKLQKGTVVLFRRFKTTAKIESASGLDLKVLTWTGRIFETHYREVYGLHRDNTNSVLLNVK